MTEYKPFLRGIDESVSDDRTVAVVLYAPPGVDGQDDMVVRPFADTTLMRLAFARLAAVEADEKWFATTNETWVCLFEEAKLADVGLLHPSDLPLQSEPIRAPVRASYLLTFSALYPFLRASTVSEAVRLFKMRTDILSLTSCVRVRDPLCDERGRPLTQSAGPGECENEPRVYRVLDAVQLAPRVQRPVSPTAPDGEPVDPYLFELSDHEGFAVNSDAAFGLAAAYREKLHTSARSGR